jgi:Domain of unknown function (DUF1839)
VAVRQVRALDAARYQSHALHALDRAWPETNCYSDLWIELLHGLGHEPLAALGSAFEVDFEGDHFTFYKQHHEDLRTLYGLTVQELPVWRHITHHLVEQVSLGRPVLVEIDSFFLPDTRGTAYRQDHVKTTVGVQLIDLEEQRLGYFHNRGYFELSGEDFRGAFRLSDELKGNPNILPPYLEVVKPGGVVPGDVRAAAKWLTKERKARRPKTNPIARYRPRLAEDVKWLLSEPMASYHLYVFNTLRMLGSAYELGKSHLEWLDAAKFAEAAKASATISDSCKALLLVLARAVSRKKQPDLNATLDAMEAAWAAVDRELTQKL